MLHRLFQCGTACGRQNSPSNERHAFIICSTTVCKQASTVQHECSQATVVHAVVVQYVGAILLLRS